MPRPPSKSGRFGTRFHEWVLRHFASATLIDPDELREVEDDTPDAELREMCRAFADGRFGDVLTCQGNSPVGTPTTTREGLTCNDNDKHSNVQIDQGDYHLGKGNLELKAGSKRHQHIVGFESPEGGRTRFALVALDLPSAVETGSGKSD